MSENPFKSVLVKKLSQGKGAGDKKMPQIFTTPPTVSPTISASVSVPNVPGAENTIISSSVPVSPLNSPILEPRPLVEAKSTDSLADFFADVLHSSENCDHRTPIAITPEGVAQASIPNGPLCMTCSPRHTTRSPTTTTTTCTSTRLHGVQTAGVALSSVTGNKRKSSPKFQDFMSAKHIQTEQIMSKHALKQKLSKYQGYIDRAQGLIHPNEEPGMIEDDSMIDYNVFQGYSMIAKVLNKSWMLPRIGHDLAYGLCDYLLENGYLEELIRIFINPETSKNVVYATGLALEECMAAPNRNFIVTNNFLEHIVLTAKKCTVNWDTIRMSISIMEALFKHSAQGCLKMIELGSLDFILTTCIAHNCPTQTLRHAALALANLSMHSDSECAQRIAARNVPNWLFLLASHRDDVTCYYACLAICMLASMKEIEGQVLKSGTLSLVEPFLLTRKPDDFVQADYKLSQGRPKDWLRKLVWMLGASRKEAKSLAAFHLCMEAKVKKIQDRLEIFQEIGAVEALKEVGSSPNEVAARFASQALTIIGEEVPYKLSQQVPLWSVEDVQYWVAKIGFEKYSKAFGEQMVDGDLLLTLSEEELENDISMKSGLLRKRFIRELQSLKIAADYSSVDETNLDSFLMSICPELSVYTYRMLELGLDRSLMPNLTEEVLSAVCGIDNPIHRMKLIQAISDCKSTDDLELVMLSRHIDIFISYRRSTGNQLASLIKVLLQLRGYKVFIDVDRLYAGKFDLSLLKNIQAARHFVVVLTENSLDRLIGDHQCDDWLHKELHCAIEHNKNIIPIFDTNFQFPDEYQIPEDIRSITRFNGIRWIHEYQDACVDKLDKFIKGELNRNFGRAHSSDSPKRSVSVQNLDTCTKWTSYARLPQFAINNGKLLELSDMGAY